MKSFLDIFVCPKGHRRGIIRMSKSDGKTIKSWCSTCNKSYPWLVVRKVRT